VNFDTGDAAQYIASGTFRYKSATYSGFTFPNPAGSGFNSATQSDTIAGWGIIQLFAPTVTNSSGASSITETGARLTGELTSTGGAATTVHVYWGDNDGVTTPGNWDHDVDLGTKAASTFYTDISSLTASTAYYYRCYATNSAGSDWADATATFTTSAPPTAPTVTNSTGAGSITDTGARLTGELTSTGGAATTVHVYWGDNDGVTTPGNWDHDVDLGTKAAGTFYTDISTLTTGTTYYYRCYAINSAGSDWADATASFTTLTTPQKLIGADSSGSPGTSANYFRLTRFQAAASGSMTQFRVYSGASGNLKCAIYADSAGEPGALITAMNTGQAVTSGWNTFTFTSTPIVSGTYYWLAVNFDTGDAAQYIASGTFRYKSATYSGFTFPNPAGSGFNNATQSDTIAGWGFVVPPTPPPAPTLVSPGTAITFKWNTSSGATKYYLQVNTNSSFTGTSLFDAEVGDVVEQEVSGLSLGTTYYWRVKAGNAAGWSSWSSVRSVVANTVT
jgi:hypothetical protein